MCILMVVNRQSETQVGGSVFSPHHSHVQIAMNFEMRKTRRLIFGAEKT
jgi:hypothetical protein